MTFALIFTCILLVIGILVFASTTGRMLPVGVRLLPFISIVLLWIYTYFFVLQNESGVIDIVILILFYFITCVLVLPLGVGILVFAVLDRERVLQPEVIGDPSRKEKVCVVYHPGMTDFTITSIRTCALKLAEKGFSTTIASAHKMLAVIFKNYKALVFASPVYAGTIRPPLSKFIRRNELTGMKCYLLITGTVKEQSALDIEKASKIVTSSHGSVEGAVKVTMKENEQELRKKLESFASDIASVQ